MSAEVAKNATPAAMAAPGPVGSVPSPAPPATKVAPPVERTSTTPSSPPTTNARTPLCRGVKLGLFKSPTKVVRAPNPNSNQKPPGTTPLACR